MSMILMQYKGPTEYRRQTFDFISQLKPAETITSASVACTVWTGIDSSPQSMVSGSASISGTEVTQLIIGGIAGNIYRLNCTAITSLGQHLVLTGYLPVVEQPL